MARTLGQILSKLDRPPAAHNWALCNHQELARTRSSLVNLAMGFPTVTYQWAHTVIRNTIVDHLSDERAIQNLERDCPPSQLDENLDLLNAFLTYNASRKYRGVRVFHEFVGQFHAGPDVAIPVSPTVILNEGGVLRPLFVIGWATNRLRYFQRRLLTAVYEDAVYSLTDLQTSPGEVLFFPKDGYGNRKPEVWQRRTYEPLSKSELTDQVARFILAREEARPLIATRFARRQETPREGEGVHAAHR